MISATMHPEQIAALDTMHLVQELTHLSASLQDHAKRLITPGVLEADKRLRNAGDLDAQADILLNRAARREGSDRDELTARATWMRARANALRAGGLMPRNLQTPLDKLTAVAAARDALLAAVEALDAVDSADVSTFVAALLPHNPEDPQIAADLFARTEAPSMLCRNALLDALELLGVYPAADGAHVRAYGLDVAAPPPALHVVRGAPEPQTEEAQAPTGAAFHGERLIVEAPPPEQTEGGP